MQSYTLNRPDGALLCRVLEQHTNDAAGAILRLAWMAGLMRDEIQHLTWAQVDLLGEQLLLPDRAVPLAPELAAWLEALRQERNGSSERVVLVQGGLDDLSLRDLRLDYDIRVGGENQVLDVVRRQGSITRNEVMALLRVSKNTAYNRLRQMVARGKLTKVGNRYYLPSTVVPPEDQEQAILAYLSEAGFAYRQDIARVLRIGPRQCWPILQRMLAEHQIAKDGQKYILLQKEA